MKSVFNKTKIDGDKYMNVETKALLSEDYPEMTSVNVVNPTVKILSSKEYVVLDSHALAYIATRFSRHDLGRILSMTNMVNGKYNILYDTSSIPHSDVSLRTELDYSINKFRDFMKKLYKEGVISYMYTMIRNKEHKFIMLNPFLARKTKVFDVDCLKLFNDFKQINSHVNIKELK